MSGVMASTEWPPEVPGPDTTRTGWQCPGCRTYYSPDIRECRCESGRRPLSDRLKTQAPIRLGGSTIRFPPETVP